LIGYIIFQVERKGISCGFGDMYKMNLRRWLIMIMFIIYNKKLYKNKVQYNVYTSIMQVI